jgi:lipopolysaccharide transport system ATP-binding protein
MNNEDLAIKVENISKRYRIGLKEEMYDSFGGAIVGFIMSPLKNYRKYRSLYKFDDVKPNKENKSSDIIWALRDVSFEVNKGEVLGIIGGNGAGKSTLLKILSKITDPTSGEVQIRGRVSSLLEVGTGFHPELTGRENVYLNGTILGMSKKELDCKFSEIVDFAGVKRFIDTPVKRYSSGMSVRLAFSVAAHLEPDILIVDEVLAVGDVEFQKKCLGKMGDMAKGGRTILLVSHNMGAITDLCSRALLLQEGRLRLDGTSMDTVIKYLSLNVPQEGYWKVDPPGKASGRRAWLRYARVLVGDENKMSTTAFFNQEIKIEIGYEIRSSVRFFRSYLFMRDSRNNIIWASHDTDGNENLGDTREKGIYKSTCIFQKKLLRPGRYHVSIGIFGKPREDVEEEHLDVISFDITEADYQFSSDPRFGLITPCLKWNIICQNEDKRSHVD